MKITILTEYDYSGSGLKLRNAIREYTDHDIEVYAFKKGNSFRNYGIPSAPVIKDLRAVQKRIDRSDIIHIKGDRPPAANSFLGLMLHKPIVTTVSGSNFRKKQFGGNGAYSPEMFGEADLRTSFECDLLYPEYGSIWTPHPIDSVGKPNLWEYKTPLLMGHSPSYRRTKDTKFILAVFKEIKNRGIADFFLIEKMPQSVTIEKRTASTIFFDQFMVGFYGNSAVEAMQYGIPTASWISELSRQQGDRQLTGNPVISFNKSVKLWVEKLIELLLSRDKLQDISINTKEYCDKVHSYQAVARQWDELYQKLS